MAFMYSRCPHAECTPWMGEEVHGPDGRPLFQVRQRSLTHLPPFALLMRRL